MSNVISESGMDFIADNTFYIEESTLFKNIGDGIKSVEFIRVIDDKLLFVEAKTTFPNPNNPSIDNYQKFLSEANDICEKFIHSLNILASVKVCTTEEVFPDDFILPEKVIIVFILVIKNHELKWCKPIKKKIISTLPLYLKKIWKPEIYVINKNMAIKYNLIIANSDKEALT